MRGLRHRGEEGNNEAAGRRHIHNTRTHAHGNAASATPTAQTAPKHTLAHALKPCSTFEAEGHDLHSLLYAFLDELLFVFATELLVCREVEVTALDRKAWRIAAVG